MKLSFSTLGCPAWTWPQIVDQAVALGFQGIELRGVGPELHLNRIPEFTSAQVATTMAGLRARGLELCSLDTSCKYHDAPKYERNLAEARDAIDLGRVTGAPIIRVQGDHLPAGAERDATFQRIVDGMGAACAHAKGSGVRVCLETHGDFITIPPVKALCDAVGPDLGIIWDIQHTHRGMGQAWPEFPRTFADRIVHVHIKDFTYDERAKQHLCHIGQGVMPIEEAVRILVAIGYTGYLSLEWEKRWEATLAEPEVAFPLFITHLRGILARQAVARQGGVR